MSDSETVDETTADEELFNRQATAPLRVARRLTGTRAKGGVKSPHFWIICVLMAVMGYVYYGVLTAYHDIYVILFFYPLIYAAIVYRLRGVVVTGVVFLGILLPHALLFLHDPYSLSRSLLLALFAFLISGLGATLLNILQHQLESYEEILSLNEELNKYIKRLRNMQNQLIQAEKLNALGQLSAAIAHEINNPLAGVLVYAQLLKKKFGDSKFDKDEATGTLSKIESAVTHCAGLVKNLLDFARQTKPSLQPVKVSDVLDQVMSLVGHQAQMKHVGVAREEDNSLPSVMVDFGQIQQVFINLVVNAIQAMSEGGKLTIRASLGGDGFLQVSFQDTGIGIPPENMDKLFTPFFTTREEVKGVGLGLSVSYGIVESHGGRIEVDSEVGEGSTFTVHLPVALEQNQ